MISILLLGYNRFNIGLRPYTDNMGKDPRVQVILKIMSQYLKSL